VDTPTLPLQLDEQAYKVDGVLGSVMVRGQIAVFLDVDRLLEMWEQMHGRARRSLPGAAAKKVLLVEDTQFFQRLIRSHLEAEGFEVIVAGNGAEALKLLETGSFDLIVSDIEMPELDGFALARHIREQSRHAALPMLALTTLNTAEHRSKAVQSGFDAYEVKLDRGSFISAVRELLQRGRATALTHGGQSHE
jgi:two-component system chemotaxis sensor kinase CheA